MLTMNAANEAVFAFTNEDIRSSEKIEERRNIRSYKVITEEGRAFIVAINATKMPREGNMHEIGGETGIIYFVVRDIGKVKFK